MNKRISEHPLYGLWCSMITRCSNPKVHNYRRYGGRGIKVCERWRSFKAFVSDVSPRPSPAHTLDRYPNRDGDYDPSNWRWSTPKEQALNCNRTKLVTVDGITDSEKGTVERIGIPSSTFRDWVKSGYSPQEVIDRWRARMLFPQHSCVRLNWEAVDWMRFCFKRLGWPQWLLVECHPEVSKATIGKVLRNETWRTN
jgi:hypothetical protein